MAFVPSSHEYGTTAVHSTPAWCVRPLRAFFAALNAPYNTILRRRMFEPACGSGALVRALRAPEDGAGHDTGSTGASYEDAAYPVSYADVEPRPAPYPGADTPLMIDFLRLRRPPVTSPVQLPRTIITNPPFKLATDFIVKGRELLDGVPTGALLLFLPVGALATERRSIFMSNGYAPTSVLAFSERPLIYADGAEPKRKPNGQLAGGVIDYAWFIWMNDTEGRHIEQRCPVTGAPAFAWSPPGCRPGTRGL